MKGWSYEVVDLKHGECRTKLAIHKNSKYRNTYCSKCDTARPWERVDSTVFDKRHEKVLTKYKQFCKEIGCSGISDKCLGDPNCAIIKRTVVGNQ